MGYDFGTTKKGWPLGYYELLNGMTCSTVCYCGENLYSKDSDLLYELLLGGDVVHWTGIRGEQLPQLDGLVRTVAQVSKLRIPAHRIALQLDDLKVRLIKIYR
jgi:hypothetical protein